MALTLSIYAIIVLATLAALSAMILKIGDLMAACPERSPAVRVSAVTITTGFAAIGAGGVILIAALLPALRDAPVFALLIGLGLASLCLGLGFTQAVATLRAVLEPPVKADPPFET